MTTGANQLTARATSQHAPPPTPSGQVRAFADALVRLGYDAYALLAGEGFHRSDLEDPDALLPCAVFGRMLERAAQARVTSNLGVRLAAETPIGAYPLLDYLVITSDNVGEGVKQLARYFRLLQFGVLLDVREDEDPIRVLVDNPAPIGAEYTTALCVLHLRGETENRLVVTGVSFAHRPDDVAEIERVLGCPVRAEAAWTGLALARESWRLPMRRRDPVLRSVLERHAGRVSPSTPALDPIGLDVRRVVASRLAQGETQIAVVARELATSPRTLQRRLAAAGLSYQSVVDRARRDAAERCVADSTLALAEVAYLLGYSEPAAFHRAFKRWTGMTPHAFRRRERERVIAAGVPA